MPPHLHLFSNLPLSSAEYLIFFTSGLGFSLLLPGICMGGRLDVGGGGVVCTESIQGVVISAFHFSVQLERSRFQIHPHTGTAREESAGEGGNYSRGMGQHGQGWGPWHGYWEPWQI